MGPSAIRTPLAAEKPQKGKDDTRINQCVVRSFGIQASAN
jgi:hypothetical protein